MSLQLAGVHDPTVTVMTAPTAVLRPFALLACIATLPSAPSGPRTSRIETAQRFFYFFSETPSRIRKRPRCYPQRRGASGAGPLVRPVRSTLMCLRRACRQASALRRSRLNVEVACVRRSSVAARDTAICCATPHVRLRRTATRAQHAAKRMFRVRKYRAFPE